MHAGVPQAGGRTRADVIRQAVGEVRKHGHVRKLRSKVAAVAHKLAARPHGRAGAAVGAGVAHQAELGAAVDSLGIEPGSSA